MVSYIGSWLGGSAKSTNASWRPSETTDDPTEVEDGRSEDEFESFDSTEQEEINIEEMSAQILQNFGGESSDLQELIDAQKEANESVPIFSA